MDSQQPKSIALAVTAVLFLALGAGAGAIWMNRYKDQVEADRQEREEEERKQKFAATPPDKIDTTQPQLVGMGAGRPAGNPLIPNVVGAGGGNRGSAKMQLASLVNKLDILTHKPLAVSLTSEQRAKLAEQIKGLLDQDELSDTDAKKRLDVVLEIVKADKETLEAAGFRWPGQQGGGGGGGQPPKNPFKEDDKTGAHLKSLQELLVKPSAN